jgi:hypothetical protein
MLELLQIFGVLLRVFAFVVLAVTLAITLGVAVCALWESQLAKSGSAGQGQQHSDLGF